MELQKKRFGTQDREQFDDWNNSEKYELDMALGGEEMFAQLRLCLYVDKICFFTYFETKF